MPASRQSTARGDRYRPLLYFLIGESTARGAARVGRLHVDEPHDTSVTPAEVVTRKLCQSSTPPEADPPDHRSVFPTGSLTVNTWCQMTFETHESAHRMIFVCPPILILIFVNASPRRLA